MIVYKCDRCGKCVNPSIQKYNIYKTYFSFMNVSESTNANDEVVHLCPECTKAFEVFLEGYFVNTDEPIGGFHNS